MRDAVQASLSQLEPIRDVVCQISEDASKAGADNCGPSVLRKRATNPSKFSGGIDKPLATCFWANFLKSLKVRPEFTVVSSFSDHSANVQADPRKQDADKCDFNGIFHGRHLYFWQTNILHWLTLRRPYSISLSTRRNHLESEWPVRGAL